MFGFMPPSCEVFKGVLFAFLFKMNFRRPPMFAFEFEKALFAFEADRPQAEPLFALLPT